MILSGNMKNRIITISKREIKKSFKRFLSLLVMSFLGVAVFVGMKSSPKTLQSSLDKYYDINNVYDIKIVSTLGLTGRDLEEFSNIELIENGYAIHTKDVSFKNNDDSYVMKIIELNENVNKIALVDGRLPIKENEIVVEEYFLTHNNMSIGDEIYLINTNDDLKHNVLTIVGTVKSPIYLLRGSPALLRGTTNIASGQINFYGYSLNSLFNMDYYTEIYLTVKNAKELITSNKEYVSLVDKAIEEIEEIKSVREKERYTEIYNQILEEINNNEEKGEIEFNDALRQLDNAKEKLDNGYDEIKKNERNINKAKTELKRNLNILNNTKNKLEDSEKELYDAKKELENGRKEIEDILAKYNLTIKDVLTISDLLNLKMVERKDLHALIKEDNPLHDELNSLVDYFYDNDLFSKINEIITTRLDNAKDEIIKLIPNNIEHFNEIVSYIEKLDIYKIKDSIFIEIFDTLNIENIKKYINKDVPYYDRIINFLDSYKDNIENIKFLLENIYKLINGEKEIESSEKILNDAKKEYDKAYIEYLNYKSEMDKASRKIKNSYNTYNINLNLYNENYLDYLNKQKDFEKQINEAKDDLSKLEVPSIYITSRNDNSDYESFINVGNSIDNLSKAFPTVFFIVSVFMSIMCMSRMALEDRGEIGTLKSLGYSNMHIITKYIIYSLTATLIGGILGSIFGFFFLTWFVFKMYGIIYSVSAFNYYFDITPFLIGIIISSICITGSSVLTVISIVKENTALLLRPKAPKSGKKILFERLPIWNGISFSNKITIRNIFRYKKRVAMTIIGIVGCTILLLTGYGIKDSIVNITTKHYGEVFEHSDMVYLKETKSTELFNKYGIKNHVDARFISTIVGINPTNLVAFNNNDIDSIVHLKSIETGEKISIEDDKVVISDKLAKINKLKAGDTIKINYNDNKTYEFVIQDIFESYIGHHILMNRYTYEKNIGEYFINFSYINEKNVSDDFVSDEDVLVIVNTNYTKQTVSNMLDSLNNVVYILIFFSALLSFVVLYNLSYININERKREIASLKVLGFYNNEVDNYIIKENLIITLTGIIIGLLIGKYFVYYIVNSIEIDLVKFIHVISVFSYIKTMLFMILFAIIVSFIIHFTLKKINMIDSLKSVE